jgi:Fic family protein
MQVRTKSSMIQWLKYFLVGVEETATKAVETLSAIMRLKIDIERQIQQTMGRRSHSGLKLLNHLFKEPMISIKDVERVCQLSTKAANELVRTFNELKWLKQISKSERYRLFVFEPYLNLFQD